MMRRPPSDVLYQVFACAGELCALITRIHEAAGALDACLADAPDDTEEARAEYSRDRILTAMEALRGLWEYDHIFDALGNAYDMLQDEYNVCDNIAAEEYRKAAIDALGEEPKVWSKYDDYALGERSQWRIDKLAIESVPSAQTERKKGRWIYSAGTAGTGTTALRFFPTCSECGVEHFTTNFRPNCGADMRVDETCE